MSEYIITIEQIKDLVTQSATEAIDGYKLGVVKQIWQYPLLPKIVRCRDCKHYTDDEFEYRHYCNEWCGQVEPDDFCAWALERK